MKSEEGVVEADRGGGPGALIFVTNFDAEREIGDELVAQEGHELACKSFCSGGASML